MATTVKIWSYNDLTGRSYVIEKEIMYPDWADLSEVTNHLVEQLNKENSLIMYYVLHHEEDKPTSLQWPSWWSGRVKDNRDEL